MKKSFIDASQRLLNLLKMERDDMLQVLYYAIFAGLLSLSLPLGIQAIINLIQGAQISTSWIVLVVLVSLGVVFVGALQLLQFRIIENIQQKLFIRASFEFAHRFPKIKMSELSEHYPPELANRFFDILTVQKGVSKLLLDFPAALLQIIFGLLLLSLYHPFFIIYGILLVILIYVLFKFSAQRGLETSLIESKKKYIVAHWIQEVARSVISFKLSGKTSLALEKNNRLVDMYVDARERHFKVLVFQFSKMIIFKFLVTAGLLIVGGLLVLNQQMNIGQFVASEIIILLIIGSVEKLILGLETIYDVLTSLEKIGQVFDKEIEKQEGDVDFKVEDNLNLELQDIGFNDFGKEILHDISLKISSKEKILLKGENGAGKSTLLRLIAGVNMPTSGSFYINDILYNNIKPNDYRSLLGFCLPEETPFEGTILENITFGDKTIDSQYLMEVLEIIGLLKYVKNQEKGLNAQLLPEGRKLSFTVTRKIVLARAILKNPKLLILKEPLDQFDEEETSRIIDFITSPERPWSLIVVSKDNNWDSKVDRIIEIEDGTLKR